MVRRVTKRDGKIEEFDLEKVVKAITRAFESCGQTLPDNIVEYLKEEFNKSGDESTESLGVEDIQNKVEELLMSKKHYKVAKAYMLYRNRHAEDREIKSKMDFLTGYCKAANAAEGSKYDSNANVENKNIATLIGELPKEGFIRLNRRLLCDRITKMFDKETADKYMSLLTQHFIYKNDETNLANYCASITMYPWLLEGTKSIGGQATQPTNLKAFCGGFINMVFMVSSMLSGACATPEFLMYMNYFIEKEYGEDYYKDPQRVVDLSIKRRSIDKVITDCFEQVVYSINQPTGARNFQSVFWNISYYDKYYFESIFGDFRFPDGSKPHWDSLNWLQKRFMKWFNQERTKCVLTFPVETMALLSEDGDAKDKEYADFTAEMYAEGHSFFTYISDNADSLSSCCFDKNQKILWKSSTEGVKLTTLEELHNTRWEPENKNLRIFHNGSWVKGKSIKLPNNNKMYKVVTANNKEFVMTDNHINVTLDGEKETRNLAVGDYLIFNTIASNSVPENDEHLTYEQGFVVGAFLGNGSMGGSSDKEVIYEVNFSQNENTYRKLADIIDVVNEGLGGTSKTNIGTVQNNVYPVRISSRVLCEFISKWTMWERGTYAYNKKLNLNALLQSIEFRKGILDGWYYTDGGNSNRCYTTSKELVEDMEALITSLGLQSIINISDRTDEAVVIRGEISKRNYPLYCVRWYEPTNVRYNKDADTNWVKRNNSIYFRVKSIEEIDYTDDVYCIECNDQNEPYFTLPCGLITHNCRLRNKITDNGFSYTLGAGGVSTGSKSVLTINLNRCVQYAVKNNIPYQEYIEEVVDLMHKVQLAYNENLKELQRNKMLPLFDAGYINIGRQYLTIGVNGLVESAEFLGIEISDNPTYTEYVQSVLGIIEKLNKQYGGKGLMFNCEMIPAENVGVKHAKWDKEDGYVVPRDCYNSYFYKVEDDTINVIDRFKLHGAKYIEHLTGGSALHCNLAEHLSKEQYRQLIKVAAKEGCNYFTFNIPNTVCNDCGHIDKRYLKECPHCHSTNVDYLTRIIGYMKRVSNFSAARQVEANKRYYAKL